MAILAPRTAAACKEFATNETEIHFSLESTDGVAEVVAAVAHDGLPPSALDMELDGGGEITRARARLARIGERHYARLPLSDEQANALRRGQPLVVRASPVFFADEGIIAFSADFLFVENLGGSAQIGSRVGADRVMFFLLVGSLFGILLAYRKQRAPSDRLRLAAAGGVIAVLFTCTALTMPWVESASVSGQFGVCGFGFEADCAPQAVAAAVANDGLPLAIAGISAGQLSLILFLLPAFIWLMVAPASRAAQTLVISGSLPALFLAAATSAYCSALAPNVRVAGAADLVLLASAAVLIAAGATIAYGRRVRDQDVVPRATAIAARGK